MSWQYGEMNTFNILILKNKYAVTGVNVCKRDLL